MNLLEIVLTLHDGLVSSWLRQVILRPLTDVSTVDSFTSVLMALER